jgi:hypothetical protein
LIEDNNSEKSTYYYLLKVEFHVWRRLRLGYDLSGFLDLGLFSLKEEA